jgi:RNA polymerase subunit RPABC4/transcription elongation factor Spt4
MSLIECEDCGKEISDKATTCPGCGAPTLASPPPSPTPEEVICAFCKKTFQDDGSTCPHCGGISPAGAKVDRKRMAATRGFASGVLVKCESCGKEIAATAPTCPGCGAENTSAVDQKQNSTQKMGCVLIALASVIGVGGVAHQPLAVLAGIMFIAGVVVMLLNTRVK